MNVLMKSQTNVADKAVEYQSRMDSVEPRVDVLERNFAEMQAALDRLRDLET